ncbi:MAG: FtsX-like permease family protein, partial [Bacteroidales bacterium]|nr:FtsX-like permease family protein [Bacteroidales bacterium]
YLFAETTVANIPQIRAYWEQQCEGIPLEITTLQDRYTKAYKNEDNELKIINFFTIISLLTTCVGLFGVMLMVVQKRIKEIGIRKVNGARIWEVLYLLNMEIIVAIIIGFIFSLPIAYYLLNNWLQNFVERIQLDWWIFILSGLIVSFTALFTSSWHCWRAARRNPVEALRYE